MGEDKGRRTNLTLQGTTSKSLNITRKCVKLDEKSKSKNKQAGGNVKSARNHMLTVKWINFIRKLCPRFWGWWKGAGGVKWLPVRAPLKLFITFSLRTAEKVYIFLPLSSPPRRNKLWCATGGRENKIWKLIWLLAKQIRWNHREFAAFRKAFLIGFLL